MFSWILEQNSYYFGSDNLFMPKLWNLISGHHEWDLFWKFMNEKLESKITKLLQR